MSGGAWIARTYAGDWREAHVTEVGAILACQRHAGLLGLAWAVDSDGTRHGYRPEQLKALGETALETREEGDYYVSREVNCG